MSFMKNDIVMHADMPQLGIGKVLEHAMGDKVRIFFLTVGEKKFDTNFAKLVKVEGDQAHHPLLDNLKIPERGKKIEYRRMEELIQAFLEMAPDGFQDTQYQEKFRTKKVELHRQIVEWFEKERLQSQLAEKKFSEICQEALEAVGLRFETGLVSLVLEDVEGEPGSMSLLQQAMRELYERRHGRWLRVETWEELGRIAAVVVTMAERVVAGLAAVDQKRLRAIVVALTERARDGSTRHQRRSLSLDQLGEGAPAERAQLRRLVDDLASDGLLVETRDEELGTLIEVAHVALLREWTAAADRMMAGGSAGPVGPTEGAYNLPPDDTGEAIGLPPLAPGPGSSSRAVFCGVPSVT